MSNSTANPIRVGEFHDGEVIELSGDSFHRSHFIECEFTGRGRFKDCTFTDCGQFPMGLTAVNCSFYATPDTLGLRRLSEGKFDE
jgi:hypothetical protein